MNLNESKALKDIAKSISESNDYEKLRLGKNASIDVVIKFFPNSGCSVDDRADIEFTAIDKNELKNIIQMYLNINDDLADEICYSIINGGNYEYSEGSDFHHCTVKISSELVRRKN